MKTPTPTPTPTPTTPTCHNLYDLGNDVAIMVNFKLGSSAILSWLRTQKITDIIGRAPGREMFPPDVVAEMVESKTIYAVWRPPYPRLVSGLHTGLSLIANNNRTNTIRSKRMPPLEKFKLLFAEWSAAELVTHNVNVNHQDDIIIHTQSLQGMVSIIVGTDSDIVNRIKWIHLNQLSSLPAYLLDKHKLRLPPINRMNYYDDNESMPPMTLIQKEVLFDLIANDQVAENKLQTMAANDWVPSNILDLSSY